MLQYATDMMTDMPGARGGTPNLVGSGRDYAPRSAARPQARALRLSPGFHPCEQGRTRVGDSGARSARGWTGAGGCTRGDLLDLGELPLTVAQRADRARLEPA